jgi:hypothetical protein
MARMIGIAFFAFALVVHVAIGVVGASVLVNKHSKDPVSFLPRWPGDSGSVTEM